MIAIVGVQVLSCDCEAFTEVKRNVLRSGLVLLVLGLYALERGGVDGGIEIGLIFRR